MQAVKQLLAKIASGNVEYRKELQDLAIRLQQLDIIVSIYVTERNKLMTDSQPFTWINMPSQGRFLIREKDKYEKNYINGCANSIPFNN